MSSDIDAVGSWFDLIDSPETIPEKLVYYPTVGSVVGAWLGSIVIPLDWDRPWQVGNSSTRIDRSLVCCRVQIVTGHIVLTVVLHPRGDTFNYSVGLADTMRIRGLYGIYHGDDY